MNSINKICPRSGKPVMPDSMTEYKGYTVGFCNPGCRDDFDARTETKTLDTQYFDAVINEGLINEGLNT